MLLFDDKPQIYAVPGRHIYFSNLTVALYWRIFLHNPGILVSYIYV